MRAGSPWRVGTVHSSHVITTNLSHRLSHNCHTSCHIFSHTNCRKRGYKSCNVPIFHKRCNQILSLTYQTSCQKHKLPHKTVMTTKTAMMTVSGNNCRRRMSVTRTVMSVTTTTMSVTTTVMSVTLANDSDGASCSFSRHSQPSHQCHNYKLEEVISKK